MPGFVSFVNRVSELSLIEEAFRDLLNKQHLSNPIINFYGVEGIGKTSILTKVIEKCNKHTIPYISAEADQDLPQFSKKIRAQIEKYYTTPLLKDGKDKEQRERAAEPGELIRALLERGPLVLLLDAVDTTNESQLVQIENLLHDLLIYDRLFVVLTSRRSIAFEQSKSVARKLLIFPVQPLDREGTELYLDSINFPADSPLRQTIFEWTRGYPLAMNAMVQALEEGITPAEEQGKQDLMARIVESVIAKGLLAQVKTEDPAWIKTALNLLAVPRRFNLVILQKLIERFEPELGLSTSMAYMTLPKRIARSTGVIGWDLIKAGFAIDEPVRNILLLQLKIGQPQRYYEINSFLAQINWRSASEVTGLDRIRYQREYVYHSANSVAESLVPQTLQSAVQNIIQDAGQDTLAQFLAEFIQDSRLQEDLGSNVSIVLEMIYSSLAQQMDSLYMQEKDEQKRFRYLHDFFYYTVRNPIKVDHSIPSLAVTLKERILLLQEQEGTTSTLKLYEDLGEDTAFVQALGNEFAILHALLRKDSHSSEE